jgi:lipocalin
MNALAHYALLLARSPTTQADESAKLRAEAKELYSRLETVDSDRAQRYRDMAARC